MKKMKKIVSVCFTIILLLGTLFSITGCNILNKRTKWYNEKTLEREGLEGLPKPDFKYKGHDNMFCSIKGDITEENFNAYAQELFTYMDENFEYLGTGGEYIANPHSWNPSIRFVNCERKLENYRQEHRTEEGELQSYTYEFIYFTEKYTEAPTEESNWETCNYVRIFYSLKNLNVTGEKDNGSTYVKYTYNFTISLKKIGVSTDYVDVNSKIEDYYEECYPDCGEAKVVNYYGKYDDYSYYAVMMTASNESYDDAIWTETVGDFVFHYPNGNRILMTNGYNDEFYTLTEAYEKGRLRKEDLEAIEAKHREAYPYLYAGDLPEECPENFAFSLTWNTYGISSYDSQTGLLIKTSDVGSESQEDYQTTYFLTDEQKAEIYDIIYDLGVENYPDKYNPNFQLMSTPYETIILNVQGGYVEKTITAMYVAIGDVADNEKGQRFLDACRGIEDILTATEEWKALPDYPYLYE